LYENNVTGQRFVLNEGNYSFKWIVERLAGYLGVRPPQKFISRKWLMTGAFLANTFSVLAGMSKKYDKNALNALYEKHNYKADHIKAVLDYSFIPVDESLKKTAELYRKDKGN
jgi:hypothetical protein